MRIAMGIGGDVIGTPMSPQSIVDQARLAEAEGFPSAWSVHFTRGVDALNVLAVAGTQTSRIELGVGIVPTYPRHPLALAQQAATTQALCGGRLTLGVGVSHRPVIEGMHGIPYASPAAHMRDYLSVLTPLLREGSVSHHGEFYEVEGSFTVPGTRPVSVVVGALSPKMVRVAGELADGVVTWLAGLRTLDGHIVPELAKAAAAAGRPQPRVVAAVQVAVCDDADAGRATAEDVFARYGGLENYQRLLAREGVASPGALAVVGTESEVEKQLRRYADVGATELWPTVFAVGGDADASVRRTRALLAELAPEL
ncbi:F420-dependent oxidoreductase, MSMEG_4879 family (plasmid) [Mycolicibacterium chubuense NBB4]|uniref:F420-dependent oxidoreductase, MSMEG_4879 family n=1 Tax=Mycolicibacterium chubuense (strain NBB4) TaxID=710421 RepID=I4BS61_MYCCN|nr:TIGR03564 family F420-dependent LLM class oxidoreductase [Mycolicibacterium chubuense]AFM20118.1 F420-dependent oxidoreductase, MSMEG_4879 family [Mycolicibacterium chubuense NBB4]